MRLLVTILAMCLALPAAAAPRTIVLIGGDAPHNHNVHDAAQGIARLAAALAGSPDLPRTGLGVRSYPRGWPDDPRALADAATIVLYFDGLERHPLRDPARRTLLAAAMARGAGLVTLHQASTLLPEDRAIPLAEWLGGARYGMVDRTVERVRFVPARHPIGNGVGTFTYRDEFYPTLALQPGVVPILRAPLHLEAAPAAPPTWRTTAWAFTRPGGGRSFGFTGFHYLDTLDQPPLRKLLLNAIVWTASAMVPRRGIRAPDDRKFIP